MFNPCNCSWLLHMGTPAHSATFINNRGTCSNIHHILWRRPVCLIVWATNTTRPTIVKTPVFTRKMTWSKSLRLYGKCMNTYVQQSSKHCQQSQPTKNVVKHNQQSCQTSSKHRVNIPICLYGKLSSRPEQLCLMAWATCQNHIVIVESAPRTGPPPFWVRFENTPRTGPPP
jgi:hypothetical protein